MIYLKALITGASGFVGKHLSQAMKDRGFEVLGIARSAGDQSGYKKCDILEKRNLKNILRSYKPDYIIHLASPAYIPDSYKRPKKTYDIIFKGTLNLLECIKELKLSSKLLYISSADIYGSGNKSVLIESDPYEPVNPYSSAKACSELLCRQFFLTYDLNIVVARPFNHTGPGQSPDFVCSNFAHQVASMQSKGENTIYTGNIDVSRDFLDVKDVIDAYLGLLLNGRPGEIYNVCSGKAVKIRRIIELLFKEAGIDHAQIIIDPNKAIKNDIPIRVGDNQKIFMDTGWAPKYNVEQTFIDLFHYWKENLHVKK